MNRYIFVLILVFVLLSACNHAMSYDYDLIKVIKMKSPPVVYEGKRLNLNVTIALTPIKRKLGATIKNGPPYSVDVCIDNNVTKLPEIENVNILKKLTDTKYTLLRAKLDLKKSWNNVGAFSCMDNLLEFEEPVNDKAEFCMDISLNWNGEKQNERRCFVFVREKGVGKMTLKDVLNQ